MPFSISASTSDDGFSPASFTSRSSRRDVKPRSCASRSSGANCLRQPSDVLLCLFFARPRRRSDKEQRRRYLARRLVARRKTAQGRDAAYAPRRPARARAQAYKQHGNRPVRRHVPVRRRYAVRSATAGLGVALMNGSPPDKGSYEALDEHCYYCFQVLVAALGVDDPPTIVPFPDAQEKVYVLPLTQTAFCLVEYARRVKVTTAPAAWVSRDLSAPGAAPGPDPLCEAVRFSRPPLRSDYRSRAAAARVLRQSLEPI